MMSATQGNVTGRKPGGDTSGHSGDAHGARAPPQSVEFEDLLDDKEVAQLLKQKPQTLAGWRCENKGPEYIKVGRRVLYRRSALQAWLASQIVRPGEAA